MNTKNFTKWMLEKLIPNLSTRSAVVIDTASYHLTDKQVSDIKLQQGSIAGDIREH